MLQGENRFQETVEEEGIVRSFGSKTLSRHGTRSELCSDKFVC